MKISYNWLKWYVPEVPESEKLADIITYHLAEVETVENLPDGDSILDIKILPNRAHDLLSHKGVAQELASLLNIKYVDPTPLYKFPPSKPTGLKIELETDPARGDGASNCRRYAGRIVKGVKVGPSPDWVVKHLESIGQRSINNMVDAANLVMYNCGQPTHVFDLNKVKDRLVVRQARAGEELTTLDNRECKLKPENMVIADAERALAIAGIKGGKIAEVDNNTTDIIIEVANFDPVSVRKTAQALNIFTDARKRFENDLSPELGYHAMTELSALIYEMCPDAVFEDIVDVYPKKQEIQKLSFRTEKISKVLGLEVSPEEIKDILKRYNFEHTEDGGNFEITVPAMRMDITMEEDMAEEIGRVLGYDRLKGEIPKLTAADGGASFEPKVNETYTKVVWARNKLMSEGYSEVMNSSFRDKGEVSVLASASDKNFLRTNLTDGLKESIKLNQANAPLLGTDKIKVFEIGTVFKKSGEEMRVAYGDKKEVKETTLEEFVSEKLSPDEHGYNSFEKFLVSEPPLSQGSSGEASRPQNANTFKMWPLFPFIARDIAVWVPEGVESVDVEKVIKENAGDMVVRGPELFDEFKKLVPAEEGGGWKVSYAFRIVFQSYDRTLTDAEVNEVMSKITEKITENKDWQVR